MEKDTLTIGGQNFEIIRKKIKQIDLKFYPENPRIYSLVFNEDESPDQYDIETKLINTEHVKQLSQSIKANGGLIDSILIRSGDNVVIEGNCRLAAYRLLAKKDAIKWGEIKCKILPHDIDDNSIFKLLGQYHIIGRKDWAPFEQAGYLWRRKQKYGIDESNMGTEMGIAISRIKRLISIYQFMSEKKDLNSQNWSYYEEYFKSATLKKIRKTLPELDDAIVRKIKSGEFTKSNTDIRNLSKIANLSGKDGKQLTKKFIKGEQTLDELLAIAKYKGADNSLLKSLNSFRVLIHGTEIKKTLQNMTIPQLNAAEYDLKKIEKQTKKLLKQLEKEKQINKKGNTNICEGKEKVGEKEIVSISADLIPQFSNFYNGSYNLVNLIYNDNKKGLSFDEIGKSFLGKNKSHAALKKYGENHAKFAELLKFVKINSESPRKVYITDLGIFFIKSSETEQKNILLEQLQKMALIKDLRNQNLSNFDLLNYLKQYLADSTAKRRYSNIKQIIKLLADNSILNFKKIYNKL